MSIYVGDLVRTRAGHERVVTSILDGGRHRTYALAPLPGAVGRRSYAETVVLIRTAQLRLVYACIGEAKARHEQGRTDAAVRSLEHAQRTYLDAMRRGEDGPGALDAGRQALALAYAIVSRDA